MCSGHRLALQNDDQLYRCGGMWEKGKLKETDLVHVSEDAWRRGGAVTEGSTMFLEVNSNVGD